ncbi:FAD/NAD(P)-binding domain-containing protein, partial [Macrolepiota fuliginosa MF-IS2]
MHPINSLHEYMQSMKLSSKRPSLLIDFIIVGGGVAGLASAFALAKSGHRVQVLEKTHGLHQRSGGIRVPPNLTKILLEWGLHEELAAALTCRKSQFHSFHSGEVIGFLEWQEDIIQEAGAEFLLMHYDDLHQALYRLAISAGATVTFGTSIRSVYFDDTKEQPVVVLEDGTELSAEVIIGADGYRSVVRKTVAPEADVGVDTKHSFYTVTVPTSEMRKDPELRQYAELSEWPIWMGDSRSALGYPIRDGKEYSLHVYWPDEGLHQSEPVEEGWDVTVPTSIIDFEEYDPRIQRLFNLAPTALRTRFIRREIAEDWLDESGRILLIGEAAHPLLAINCFQPCTMQGPSLAVEDAAVLGVLMSRLSTREQIPQLLEAFHDVRHERCIQVHTTELRNAMLVTLPPGEDREMRDAGMRLSLPAVETNWDDTKLREQWDEIGEVFGYNAREAAEDWWVKWGSLGSTAGYPVHEPLDLIFEVTKVAVSE